MRFDDRLLTVLNQPAGDRHDIAVRWRQLVDLVARAGANAGSGTVARAMETIRADAANVDETLRAAAARAVAALPLPLALLEVFASDSLTVSAPVLAAATLEPAQWAALMETTDEETRRFIEALHPEIRPLIAEPAQTAAEWREELPQAAEEPPPPSESSADLAARLAALAEELRRPSIEPPRHQVEEPQEQPQPVAPSLHEVVERIERRRRARALHRRGAALASMEAPTLFRWETGPGGEIAWVEGAPRGALVGRSIAKDQPAEDEQLDPQVVRAFMLRAPFRDASLSLAGEGPLSGEWKISGVPAFEPADGRFAGYRGIALRERTDADQAPEAPELLSDPDSVRELVHEIKTPLNAILGFAEIIEGQYLGPAEEPYRDRAREIVAQASLLLTAIDDIDFSARVHSSAAGGQARVDLAQLLEQGAPALRQHAAGRGVELEVAKPAREAIAATEPELADRLIYRLGMSTIDQAGPGERLRLSIEQAGSSWRLSISRPAALDRLPEEDLLGPKSSLEQGFSFRLVRGLARIAGADLVLPQGRIALLFPRA